ncbi:MAG TPA: amino acid racemase [Ignavibacteriaceae bacterium]|jgi:aspartate racemase|nr:amino acid racemase [Ignavibacteriaceae bacterium]
MKNKPLVGILGGMGTFSGLYFQNLFFEVCTKNGASGDQNYPEWVYLNASLAPDRTAAINKKGDSPVPYLVSQLKKMESIGVEIVVVTCNTAHAFFKEIKQEVSLPWIHLPYETVIEVMKKQIKSIGIVGTEGTRYSGIYRNALQKAGVEVIEPDEESQKLLMSAIYDEEFGIKHTGSVPSEKAKVLIKGVINEMKVSSVLSGCTELSLAFSSMNSNLQLFDPMEIAAQSLFDFWSGKRSVESFIQ